jgi:hypothetical protein
VRRRLQISVVAAEKFQYTIGWYFQLVIASLNLSLVLYTLAGIYVRFTQVLVGYGCTRVELPDLDGHVIDRYAETMFLKKYGLGGFFHGSKTPWVHIPSGRVNMMITYVRSTFGNIYWGPQFVLSEPYKLAVKQVSFSRRGKSTVKLAPPKPKGRSKLKLAITSSFIHSWPALQR